ncbi:hypothetical protein [Nocardia sp. NPDC020380]|uniref:hypothetical protein n=1 Tax=Nocardia sp. NPDC020380 TaxID=3364309 RepID=UPI0037AB4302
MRKNIIHVVTATLFFLSAVALIDAAPASAVVWVSPEQCEDIGEGNVHVTLDPIDKGKAVCTCKGGHYDGANVEGQYFLNGLWPITCVSPTV